MTDLKLMQMLLAIQAQARALDMLVATAIAHAGADGPVLDQPPEADPNARATFSTKRQ